MQSHTTQPRSHHSRREYPRLYKWPIPGNHNLFHTCCGTSVGKVRVSGFGLRQTEFFARDCRDVSCETSCLISVSVSRSGSRHKADPPFHAITKVPRILDTSTVLTMGINKGVNEAHHHYPKLKASQEHPGDQVMKEMISLWKYCSMSPERSKCSVQPETLIVM